jgi:hypothetical protein
MIASAAVGRGAVACRPGEAAPLDVPVADQRAQCAQDGARRQVELARELRGARFLELDEAPEDALRRPVAAAGRAPGRRRAARLERRDLSLLPYSHNAPSRRRPDERSQPMFKTATRLTTLVSALALSACAADALDPAAGTGAIIDIDCAEGPECPAGFECEVEEEHGVVTSFCKAHEDSDPGCPPGYELEIEHGQAFCMPHGGDDDAPGDDDGSGDDDAPQGDECAVDVDCGGGLECEDGFCVPHGGDVA